jgi:ABC-type nitrate/sulfonate/bicarbonate transport system ATPase subunit
METLTRGANSAMLNLCLFTVEDEQPEQYYWPIHRELAEWLFVRKGLVRLHSAETDEGRWAHNLTDWRDRLAKLAAWHDLTFCTVDLRIPESAGATPHLDHGLSVIREIALRTDVRCCVLTGVGATELRERFGADVPEVPFDFKHDAPAGPRNVVTYVKSQVLAQIDRIAFPGPAGKPIDVWLGDRTGRLRNQYLSKAPYLADAAGWHVPMMLLSPAGLGRRTLVAFIAYLAEAELVAIDLSGSRADNRGHFATLEQFAAGLIQTADDGARPDRRQLLYVTGLDRYEPGVDAQDDSDCLWPLQSILDRLRRLGPQAENFPFCLALGISGESRMTIPSRETRTFLRSVEETIGELSRLPLQHLGLDGNGWAIEHPRILRLPTLEERGTEFLHSVIRLKLERMKADLPQRLPKYRGEELTLSPDVADAFLDKIPWAANRNLGGLSDALDAAFANFLTRRGAAEYQISTGHLEEALQQELGRTVLSMDDVRLDFVDTVGHPVPIIGRADFAVRDGELLVVLGPSGCGKSTLLRLFAGLLMPTAGRVLYRGQPIQGPSEKIGLVFQNYSLFPWLTVYGNIAFGNRAREGSGGHLRDLARDPFVRALFEAARFPAYDSPSRNRQRFEDRYPHQLSGGEQQRVAIIRSLINRPDVLLMDEPFGALDLQTRWQMQNFLIAARQLSSLSIVFVTHDIDEAVYLADRVLIASPKPLELTHQFPIPFAPDARTDALRRDPAFVRLTNQVREALLSAATARTAPEGSR